MGDKASSAIVSRRLLLGALFGSAAGHAFANAPLTSIRPIARAQAPEPQKPNPVADLIAEARLDGKVGFVVADANSGEVLEVHNPLTAMPPASVTKTITALYALNALGAKYRFQTCLLASAPINNGRLDGDLILVGGGDPTLDTKALAKMAAELKDLGLRKVTGRFLIYSDVLPAIFSIDPDQPDHMGYNPAISGLNLNFNRVHFEWKRTAGGYDVTLDAPAGKFHPVVGIAKMKVVDRRVPVYTYANTGLADQWTVARGALGKAGSRWLPVRKPELYAAEVFQIMAKAYGIDVPQARLSKTEPRGELLVKLSSSELNDVLKDMLYYSTNLTAEVTGLTASRVDGNGVRSLRASAGKMTVWAKAELGTRKAKFVDHSGLGDQSRIAASDMVAVLVKAYASGVLLPILKKVPMRDRKGAVVENHPVKIRAKTGTLNFVSALAGYMTGPDGRDLAFAIFTGDLKRREKIRKTDDEIPPGARAWKSRSRRLQMQLIERWGIQYTS
jgi:D-alanyl-D-alanine carboxypeptidase/D-alanyl-D-alanine-endopeptidase (penicillin-binding protein 4)